VPYLKLFHYNNERRIRSLQLSFEWNRQIIDFEDFLQVFPEHLDFRFLIDGKLHENDDVGGESFHDLPEEEENVRLNLIKMFNRHHPTHRKYQTRVEREQVACCELDFAMH
jgi:hypothetical protein